MPIRDLATRKIKIKVHMGTGYANSYREDEYTVGVPMNATDEEIQTLADEYSLEFMLNHCSHGNSWEEVD